MIFGGIGLFTDIPPRYVPDGNGGSRRGRFFTVTGLQFLFASNKRLMYDNSDQLFIHKPTCMYVCNFSTLIIIFRSLTIASHKRHQIWPLGWVNYM